MGKIEVSALIKAIQESVSLLVSDGIVPRERITDPVNDAARVQDLESGYSTEIDDIVDNIPDVPPAPTLPIVQNIRCWLNQNQGDAAVSDSFNRFAYDESSHRIPYSDSLLYCLFFVYSNQALDGIFSIMESSGSVIISRSNGTNIGTIYYVLFATCSDKTATVIDVFDSQNNTFKSFKFTSEGTDYYYVLDGVQSDWTDDLSSIGYSLEPAVQPVMVYIESGNLYYQSSVKNDTSKSNSYCYAIYDDENRTTPHVFDWGKRNVFGNVVDGEFIPAAIQTQAQFPSTTGANTGYRVCVNKRDSSDINGYLWLAWNKYQDGYAKFSSPRYLMIYDDAISFWFKSDHSNMADPTYIDWNTDIDYDSNKTYKVLALVNSDGIKVNDEYLYSTTFTKQNGKLIVRITYWSSAFKPAARIVFYAEDKTVYTGYFNPGNGNAQKSVENAWASSGDQYEGVYQLNSDTAYQFNASATYTILSVFYTDGTTVTNETLAPYSISGSLAMINNPWVSGVLTVKTKVNNQITGNPCGCTFTVE